MKFTAQEEYGLRCALQVARAEGIVTIPEIADREGLTTSYVAKLMRVLLKGGVVRSMRGNQGGYHLSAPAHEITVGTVIHALGGGLLPDGFCKDHAGVRSACVHTGNCSVRSVWARLDAVLRQTMDQITLHDLVQDARAAHKGAPVRVGPPRDPRALHALSRSATEAGTP